MAKSKRKTRDLWDVPTKALPKQAALIAKAAAALMARDGTRHEVFKRAVMCRALADATIGHLRGIEPSATDKLFAPVESVSERAERALWTAYTLGFEWRTLMDEAALTKFVKTGRAGGKAKLKSKKVIPRSKARAKLIKRMSGLIKEIGWKPQLILDKLDKECGLMTSAPHTWARGTMTNMLNRVRAK